jgi:hypothetical protein
MSFPTDLGPVQMVPQFSFYHLTSVGVLTLQISCLDCQGCY